MFFGEKDPVVLSANWELELLLFNSTATTNLAAGNQPPTPLHGTNGCF
jgi:hypothetical protein